MSAIDHSHDEAIVKTFRSDPMLAVGYLTDVLASGDETNLTLALQRLSKAFGDGANLSPEYLFRVIQLHQQQKLRQLRGKLAWTGDLDSMREDK